MVMVYRGKLMGIGDGLKALQREGEQIKQRQLQIIVKLRALVGQLDHILVTLRGGGELMGEQLDCAINQIGAALVRDKTPEGRAKTLEKLQQARDFQAGLLRDTEYAYEGFMKYKP
jgi:hypothetical protein